MLFVELVPGQQTSRSVPDFDYVCSFQTDYSQTISLVEMFGQFIRLMYTQSILFVFEMLHRARPSHFLTIGV